MGQHAFGGGATGEGHRHEDVSKTVTQQPRPALERQISANHQTRKEPASRTGMVAAAGLGTAGVGAGMAGTGKRRIKRVGAAVNQAADNATAAAGRVQEARANAHGAERGRTEALASHNSTKARQAALAHWEGGNRKIPHTTRILSTTGNEHPTTVSKVPSRQHAVVRNALNRQAHDTDARAKKLGSKEQAELGRASEAARDQNKHSRLHRQGLKLQREVVPKMKARIGTGRALMVGGGLTAAAAIAHGEHSRRVNKSLQGVPLAEISKMIGFGNFRGEAGALRAEIGKPKAGELNRRLKAARNANPAARALVPAKPRDPATVRAALGKPQNTGLLSRMKQATRTPGNVSSRLNTPSGSELSTRLAAARNRAS